MRHPMLKQLRGEERIFSIPWIDLHFNKKATAYCLIATVISGTTIAINFYLFIAMFIILNGIAYPLGTIRRSSKKFEAGNVPLDVYLWRKIQYKLNRVVYIRRIVK